MKNLESKLQQECVKWFRYQYPKFAKRLFAIANGGHRHIATAKRLKAEGVLAGVPDLMLLKPKLDCDGKIWCAFFIEMKYGKGKLTDNQKEFIAAVGNDYKCVVVNSFDQFKTVIENYLS